MNNINRMSIAAYISQDLRHRIRTGATLPSQLSLTDLSRHYDVSLTPVREAIQTLIDEGYLRKHTSRRITVNPEMVGIAGADERTGLPQKPPNWESVLLDEVMHATLSLMPIYLREADLAAKLGVGRSIIRGSFSRFAGAGLLDHVPRKGWRVHPVRVDDVESYLQVREALELTALEAAKPNIERAEVLGLLKGDNHALDDTPHRYIVSKSGNQYIERFFDQYVARYYTRLLHYAAPEAHVADEMAAEHDEILRAILDRDWSKARDVLSRHIRGQRSVLETVLIASRREKQP
ncbi:MAG: GntR family transcriptional regulator [Spirochaetaceae bacterium]|nr:MAG: GntR family transcriptional regulator [Spirochaetaceae bacterium]